MVGDDIVDEQEAVVHFSCCLQRDWLVLRIVFSNIKEEFPSIAACVDGGGDAGVSSAKHRQDAFIDVVVDEDYGLLGAFDEFHGGRVCITDLSLEQDALHWRQCSLEEQPNLLVVSCNFGLQTFQTVVHGVTAQEVVT